MGDAPTTAQWTMNYCLAGIGIHFLEYRERAIAIGERIGAFRDYPAPKGCTSPFAPLWIAAMVSRQSCTQFETKSEQKEDSRHCTKARTQAKLFIREPL